LPSDLSPYAHKVPELAQLLARLSRAERVPDAAPEAPGTVARRADRAPAPRIALRGLAGSARGYLASWLQRRSGRPLLYLVPHGDAFDEARDDLEYFRGPGATFAFPEPDTLPYDPASPHPGITAQRLETLARLAAGERGAVLATVRGLLQ